MIVRTVLTATVLTVLVLLTGCGGPSTPPSTDHTDADVTFAQMMIPHHRQATDMSALAGTRAGSPEVRDLATRIEAAQGPEIDRMTRMLSGWGAPAGGTSPTMPGMMGDAEMAGLAASSGAAFDRGFLQMMISHHAGAVTMARAELDRGRNPDARALAASIIAAQQAEIAEMQGLLARS